MVSSTPEFVEPIQEYLGVACGKCQRFVAVIGPLDPIQIPRDKPMKVGSRGPLTVECPHCKHRAEYPLGALNRASLP